MDFTRPLSAPRLDAALILLAPLALLAIVTWLYGLRTGRTALSAAVGPWIVAPMGVWGAFVARGVRLWHSNGPQCFGVAFVFAVVALAPARVIRNPKLRASALGPLALWCLAAPLALVAANMTSDTVLHESLRALMLAPRPAILIVWVALIASATWASNR